MVATIINALAIVVGGFSGFLFGKLLTETIQDGLIKACGICVIFIGAAGALEGMLSIDGRNLVSSGSMLIIGCICIGTLLGEWIDIEGWFERFGAWLKIKSGNGKDNLFIEGFVTTSITVCIGAMAVVGSIQAGLLGDYSTLFTKAVLDFIIVMMLSCSLGKGCLFSAIPVFLFQGGMTLLAQVLKPIMIPMALSNLSTVGSILIFCVGINLVFGKTIRVANILPAIVMAVAAAFLPF